MLSVLLQILLALVAIGAIGGLAYGCYELFYPWLSWAVENFHTLTGFLPSWLLGLALVGLALAIVGMVVKLL